MKLVHPNLSGQIIFTENIVNVITIENRKYFTKIIHEFILQVEGEEGEFILSDKNRELEIAKTFSITVNPFDLQVNSRKNLNKIYTEVKDISQNEFNYLETAKLKAEILNYLDNLFLNYEIPLTYNDEFDITSLFKTTELKIDDEFSSLLEKIIYFIEVSQQLNATEYFAFINLKQFLSYNEIAELYKIMQYHKFHILLFESTYTEPLHLCEKHYVIDTDLCEIF